MSRPLLSFAALTRAAVMQRELPVAAAEPTHAHRHQGVVRRSHRRWPEGPLYEVQLPLGCREAGSPLLRPLLYRSNSRYRPKGVAGDFP
jgi:hypothetical protein